VCKLIQQQQVVFPRQVLDWNERDDRFSFVGRVEWFIIQSV
jgi:hypothetical protein